MQVAVIGTGNVGSALLYPLSYNGRINEILVVTRRKEAAVGAIMDVASANPKGAGKMRYTPCEQISEADIIVLTAGVQMKPGQTGADVLAPNVQIAETILSSTLVKRSAVLICLATPVDDLIVHIQKKSGLPHNQVFGFGGDLDRNRLEYVLKSRKRHGDGAKIVGEHGSKTIPVYSGEENYDEVASEIRKFLSTITKYAGETRNLATGDLLGQLVDSIVSDRKQVHYVCGYHPEYKTYMTWPFIIGRSGIVSAEKVEIFERASKDLDALVSSRKARFEACSVGT